MNLDPARRRPPSAASWTSGTRCPVSGRGDGHGHCRSQPQRRRKLGPFSICELGRRRDVGHGPRRMTAQAPVMRSAAERSQVGVWCARRSRARGVKPARRIGTPSAISPAQQIRPGNSLWPRTRRTMQLGGTGASENVARFPGPEAQMAMVTAEVSHRRAERLGRFQAATWA